MTVKIWNKKNNELLVVMKWEKGRLDSRRYNMIVNQLFMLACDGCDYDNLLATFNNTPQRIETKTYHGKLEYSSIFMGLFVNDKFVKTMTISDCEGKQMMNEKEKLMAEKMLKSGKILSEVKYYDGTKDILYRFRDVEFEGCVFDITTWNDEIVYCRFDRLA